MSVVVVDVVRDVFAIVPGKVYAVCRHVSKRLCKSRGLQDYYGSILPVRAIQ